MTNPSPPQQAQPDETEDAGNAADDDGEHLLETVAYAEKVEHGDRREQADEVSEKDDENADVKQVGAPGELPVPQELT